jgi:membrane protein DedA with SNARE-associated domain
MMFDAFALPLPQLLSWLIQYRYLLLLPIVVVEGPIITVIAGFLVSLGYLDFILAYGLAVTGDLFGDTLYYLAGRIGADRFVKGWGRCLCITWDQIDRLKQHFARHVGKTLLLGKLTQGAGGLILVAAGAAEVPYPVFLWFNLLGTLPKSLALLLVGFYFGHAYRRISAYLNDIALITIGILVLVSPGYLFYGLRSRRKGS